jgi:hypothetical protein
MSDDVERFDAGLPTSGYTRRQALKIGALSLGGAMLPGIMPGRLRADAGGNSDCAHFCTALFPPGPARGVCTSEAADGTGVCGSCAPTGFVCGSSPTACPGSGAEGLGCFCFSTTLGHGACASDVFCGHTPSCTTQSDCPSGYICAPNTCCGGSICLPICGDQGPSATASSLATTATVGSGLRATG